MWYNSFSFAFCFSSDLVWSDLAMQDVYIGCWCLHTGKKNEMVGNQLRKAIKKKERKKMKNEKWHRSHSSLLGKNINYCIQVPIIEESIHDLCARGKRVRLDKPPGHGTFHSEHKFLPRQIRFLGKSWAWGLHIIEVSLDLYSSIKQFISWFWSLIPLA